MTIIRPMNAGDYDAVFTLLRRTEGISLRGADTREAFERYLDRNPGLSLIALPAGSQDPIAGCLMAGHDGRRGYLYHLAVDPAYRRNGLGNTLLQRCVASLSALGIEKCHVDVLRHNTAAAGYWTRRGWTLRTDIDRYSFINGDDPNA